MKIIYDEAKNARNIRERQLPFSLVDAFDFNTAVLVHDNRRPYPEIRFRAIGKIGGRLHVLVFTLVPGGIRVISLRKANVREVKRYEAQTRS
jgi:uncharacterized DUF497 family protein